MGSNLKNCLNLIPVSDCAILSLKFLCLTRSVRLFVACCIIFVLVAAGFTALFGASPVLSISIFVCHVAFRWPMKTSLCLRNSAPSQSQRTTFKLHWTLLDLNVHQLSTERASGPVSERLAIFDRVPLSPFNLQRHDLSCCRKSKIYYPALSSSIRAPYVSFFALYLQARPICLKELITFYLEIPLDLKASSFLFYKQR